MLHIHNSAAMTVPSFSRNLGVDCLFSDRFEVNRFRFEKCFVLRRKKLILNISQFLKTI